VKEGIVLRDPKNKQLITTEGTLVEKSAFWLRRLKDGDCHIVETKIKETPKIVERESDDDSI